MSRTTLAVVLTIGLLATQFCIFVLEGSTFECTTGSLAGTLASAQSGEALQRSPVFLAVPVPDDQALPPIFSDSRFQPLMGLSGTELWDKIREFHAKEEGVMIYVIPYVWREGEWRELFATQSDQDGGFLFTDVWPGTYYIVAGASPWAERKRFKDVGLIPAGLTGTVVQASFSFIEGRLVAYVLHGQAKVTAKSFTVDACRRTAAGRIHLNIEER